MQRGRGGRDDFFGSGDPFGGVGGFGGPGSQMSSFLGGRDPFDNPFFSQPFGSFPSMFGAGGGFPSLFGAGGGFPSMFGAGGGPPSMFGPSMFGGRENPFGQISNSSFFEQQAPPPNTNRARGIVIEELPSDTEEGGDGDSSATEKKDNPRKHSRSGIEPYVEDPDEETEEKKIRHIQSRNEFSRAYATQPQTHAYSFQSSTVTYGGANGAYYTSSTTRRTGGDGVAVEERKEADTATGKATHRIARGIRDKGHSVTRKLNPDGKMETQQTLHNLNEDELDGFMGEWKESARQHLPGLNLGPDMLDNGNNGRGSRQYEQLLLPSTEPPAHSSGRVGSQSRRNAFDGRAR